MSRFSECCYSELQFVCSGCVAEAIVFQDLDLLRALLTLVNVRVDNHFWLPAQFVLDLHFSDPQSLCLNSTDWKRLVTHPDSKLLDYTVVKPQDNTQQQTISTGDSRRNQHENRLSTCNRHLQWPQTNSDYSFQFESHYAESFLGFDLLSLALSTKRLDIVDLILPKLRNQHNAKIKQFHRIAPFTTATLIRQNPLFRKGPLLLVTLDAVSSETGRLEKLIQLLPSLHALNICTRIQNFNRVDKVAPLPDPIVRLYRNKAQSLEKYFVRALAITANKRTTYHPDMLEFLLSLGLDVNTSHCTYGCTALGALQHISSPEVGTLLLGTLIENGLTNFDLNISDKQRRRNDSIIIEWLLAFRELSFVRRKATRGPRFELVKQMICRLISLGYGRGSSRWTTDLNLSEARFCVDQIEFIENAKENEMEEPPEETDTLEEFDEEDEATNFIDIPLLQQTSEEEILGEHSKTALIWLQTCAHIAKQRRVLRELILHFDAGPLSLRELSRNAIRKSLGGSRFKERIGLLSQIPEILKNYIIGGKY